MIRFVSLIVFSCMLLCAPPIAAQLSLDTCLQRAHRNYPAIRQYALIEQTTAYTISNAGKAYLPQLNVMLVGGVIDGLPAVAAAESSTDLKLISVIEFQQTLWDGGYTKAQKSRISAEGEMQKAELDVSMNGVRSRVIDVFFGILLIESQQAQLRVVEENLHTRHEQLKNAISGGTAYQSDEDELLVELIELEVQKENLSYAKNAYSEVLSILINTPISMDTKFAKPTDVQLNFSAEIQTPELQLFQAQWEQADAQLAVQKSALMPKVGLLGFGTFIEPGVDFGFSSVNRILVGGVSVSWNLGALYRHKNNKHFIATRQSQIEVNKEVYLFNTHLGLTQQQIAILKLQNQVEKDKEIVALKSRIKLAYDTKYANGVCTMADLLQAINSASMASQTLSRHEIELLMKKYTFLFTQGIPAQNESYEK